LDGECYKEAMIYPLDVLMAAEDTLFEAFSVDKS
jgi:hypothetical protein